MQAISSVSVAGNTATTTTGSAMSGLSQPTTTSSSKLSSSSSSGKALFSLQRTRRATDFYFENWIHVPCVITGSKSGGMLPSIPPGVTPLLGPAGPQYIMSQPLYQPAFTLNYDDLQYLPRGIHPHMVSETRFLSMFLGRSILIWTTDLECVHKHGWRSPTPPCFSLCETSKI